MEKKNIKSIFIIILLLFMIYIMICSISSTISVIDESNSLTNYFFVIAGVLFFLGYAYDIFGLFNEKKEFVAQCPKCGKEHKFNTKYWPIQITCDCGAILQVVEDE